MRLCVLTESLTTALGGHAIKYGVKVIPHGSLILGGTVRVTAVGTAGTTCDAGFYSVDTGALDADWLIDDASMAALASFNSAENGEATATTHPLRVTDPDGAILMMDLNQDPVTNCTIRCTVWYLTFEEPSA